ncbi:MAG TPA: hypothetical protein PKE51_07545 [Gemmatimonadaceae bacterium]|nr:hypothetical protein [Gemmatimonadaceae bacterium]
MTVSLLKLVASVVVLCGVALAQPQISFSGGPGSVPQGAVTATYDIYDDDGLVPDDLLGVGLVCSLDSNGWDTGTLPLECVDRMVQGPAGTSGEVEAEIYVVVTFRDSNGDKVGEVVTGVKLARC